MPATFIVYKHSGMSIDEREAFKLLDPLGEISSVKSLDIEVQAEMGLPATMVVQFKLYDPRRDVRKVRLFFLSFSFIILRPILLKHII